MTALISPSVAAKAGFAKAAFGSALLIVTNPNAISMTAQSVSDDAILPVWTLGRPRRKSAPQPTPAGYPLFFSYTTKRAHVRVDDASDRGYLCKILHHPSRDTICHPTGIQNDDEAPLPCRTFGASSRTQSKDLNAPVDPGVSARTRPGQGRQHAGRNFVQQNRCGQWPSPHARRKSKVGSSV